MSFVCIKCNRDMKFRGSLRNHLLRKTPCVQVDIPKPVIESSPIQIYDRVEPKKYNNHSLALWLWREITKTPSNVCFVITSDKNKVYVKRKTCTEIMTYNEFMEIYINVLCPLGPGRVMEQYEEYMTRPIHDFFDLMPHKTVLLNRIRNMDPTLNYL